MNKVIIAFTLMLPILTAHSDDLSEELNKTKSVSQIIGCVAREGTLASCSYGHDQSVIAIARCVLQNNKAFTLEAKAEGLEPSLVGLGYCGLEKAALFLSKASPKPAKQASVDEYSIQELDNAVIQKLDNAVILCLSNEAVRTKHIDGCATTVQIHKNALAEQGITDYKDYLDNLIKGKK